MNRICSLVVLLLCTIALRPASADDFRVYPYLQNPSSNSMTIRWFSHSATDGKLEVFSGDPTAGSGKTPIAVVKTSAEPAGTLDCNPFKEESGSLHLTTPHRHTAFVGNLTRGAKYQYRVTQGDDTATGSFKTAGDRDTPIKMLVYSDSETEPESTAAPPVAWPAAVASNRPATVVNYLASQTDGYLQNCLIMQSRSPDLILITGDLVECGGEQRDWDEFWRHNAGNLGRLASDIPILPAIGNHENYAGPGGGYTTPAANFSVAKYLTYFSVPSNGAEAAHHHGRYYRIDYGAITLITLDSSDGQPHKSSKDTNHNLEGSNAPDFNPGSEQYEWLEIQLAEAQQKSRFTFVQFHHTMFGSGPHSIPFGSEHFSGQAGVPMRVLLPLFMKYGVDVIFSGHNEMLERSLVFGDETQADGTTTAHSIHCYDVGIGGDGLRGPSMGSDNPHRQFLAHENSPEVWKDGKLISGGKHYGHLEVDVQPRSDGEWQIEIVPVYVFPIMNDQGKPASWERRIYNDVVVIPEIP